MTNKPKKKKKTARISVDAKDIIIEKAISQDKKEWEITQEAIVAYLQEPKEIPDDFRDALEFSFDSDDKNIVLHTFYLEESINKKLVTYSKINKIKERVLIDYAVKNLL